MNIHVGTNLWPETIMHARCKLFFKARGVRPEQRPHCLHRLAGKGRWPWVVGMLDPRTDAPCSRTPAFGPADHDLMIPAGHVVLVLGVLLLLTPITMLVHGLVQGLWV